MEADGTFEADVGKMLNIKAKFQNVIIRKTFTERDGRDKTSTGQSLKWK